MKNKSFLQIDKAYKDIQTILEKARSKSFKAVNTLMEFKLNKDKQ